MNKSDKRRIHLQWIRIFLSVIGLGIGIMVSRAVEADKLIFTNPDRLLSALSYGVGGLIFAIIFYFISKPIIKMTKRIIDYFENELISLPVTDVIFGAFGLIAGLIIAYLMSQPIYRLNIPYLGGAVSVLLCVVFGYLGLIIMVKKREDLIGGISEISLRKKQEKGKKSSGNTQKVLDTSVIIDGRILDICKAGFIDGPLVAPLFVLEELQHIADSADDLKRNRGRRGLDIIKSMQTELDIEIIIYDKDKFEQISEVDSKLIKLTQKLGGKILTNDYNLNKLADVQGVKVLNINELANALKPVVLPGEEMTVEVIKEGKEAMQGLSYLDDGTMIVVENGKKYIGQSINAVVTSVLQTAAGKMIFARPKM